MGHSSTRLVEQIDAFFAPAGPLSRAIPDYEERLEQRRVATAVAEAFSARRQLLAEAGTGTGKTLAYLVPAVLSGQRCVVSTATKTLQEQIVCEDVPLLSRALGRPIDVQVMKGRANYLCLARAGGLLAQGTLPHIDEVKQQKRLRAWAQETSTGDRAELTFLPDQSPLWREVSASSEQCLGRACRLFERCFVTQMRRRAQTAEVVVTNHHLYCADLALRTRLDEGAVALLPGHDLVVFDEAHELEEVSAQNFGYEVSDRRLFELARDAVRVARDEPTLLARLGRVSAELELATRRLMNHLPFGETRVALSPDKLPRETEDKWREVDSLLARLESSLTGLESEEAPLVARRAALAASELAFILRVPGRSSLVCETTLDSSFEYSQLEGEELARAAAAAPPPYVRFTETVGRARAIMARPVDVAPMLHAQLADACAVFLSATLSVKGNFQHVRRRLGIEEADEVVVASPFDYATQAAIYLPTDLPEPDAQSFPSDAAARALTLVEAAGGGAFVLCTSHRVLSVMRETLARAGLPVLVQGDGPKHRLLSEFKAAGDAVLCATMSFWQGVDVPGRALRLVILDKLPFASPADPLVAGRLAHLQTQGLEPFMSYQLPQASLMLRQGFGRLIRRRTDRGMVALFDTRVQTRGYGRLLMASLPPCARLLELAEAEHFLRQCR